nr:autotransporter outer membrane beta-barrel domain-containing protein [Bartonella raoultii]
MVSGCSFKIQSLSKYAEGGFTNGSGIEGSYKQWAVGTSFEAGYRLQTSKSSWLQPYGQITWLQVEGKEIKLSNDMSGDIRPLLHCAVRLDYL